MRAKNSQLQVVDSCEYPASAFRGSRRAALRIGGGLAASGALTSLAVPGKVRAHRSQLRASRTQTALQSDQDGQPGGTLRFAILREATTFDPHVDNGATSTTIQGNVYETLVTYDLEGGLIPSLAESWEVSEDGLVYVFNLKQGVTFQNGEPFTADDVVATIERIQDPATTATIAPQLAVIESMTATDDYTVEMTLSEPYAALLAVLASARHAGIVSRSWTDEGHDYATEMNGTGPFMLDSYEANVRYSLVKNPNYWQLGLPYLDGIEQVPIRDDTARVNAFKSGQVDLMSYVPWQDMMEFETNPMFKLYTGYETFNIVRLNPERPPFDNPLVRQALNYIVDREAIIALAYGGQGRAISVALIGQDSAWYNQDLDGHWAYDPDRARALLAEAGIDDPSTISLNFRSSSSAVHFDTAQVVAQQLEQFGFQVELEPQDSPTLIERRQTGDYQMMMDGLTAPWADPDFYAAYFASDGPAYAAAVGYSNAELDQLLEEGRTTIDFESRKEIYRAAEEVLLADPPWMFLYFRPQSEASTSNVNGYERIKGLGSQSEAFMERVWIQQ